MHFKLDQINKEIFLRIVSFSLIVSLTVLCLFLLKKLSISQSNVKTCQSKLFTSQQQLQAKEETIENQNESLAQRYKRNQFSQNQARWLKCFHEGSTDKYFSVYEFGFQLSQEMGPFNLSCAPNFKDTTYLSSIDATYLIDCTLNSSQMQSIPTREEHWDGQRELGHIVEEFKLVAPVKFVIGSVSDQDELNTTQITPQKAIEYEYNFAQKNNFDHHQFTFITPKQLNARPGSYGQHTLILRTYDSVTQEKISELAEKIIDSVSFINLQKNSNQCFYSHDGGVLWAD